MAKSPTIGYFGVKIVEEAISDYFAREGLTEVARDELMALALNNEDEFFQIVEDFVMRNECEYD